MALDGLGGGVIVGCNALSWVVGFGAGDEVDRMVEVLDGGCGDNPRSDACLDFGGPSIAATTPCLLKNFLNSYLAGWSL